MSVLAQVDKAASLAGSAFKVADTLFQNQVAIEEAEGTISPESVIINATIQETLDLSVDITDKPIAPITSGTSGGSAIDYINRRPVTLVLTGVLSNRSLDLITDPVGTLTQAAGSLAPGVFSAIQQGADLAAKFFDLGRDEIDKKLQLLYKWQVSGIEVFVTGVRLDINQLSSDREFVYVIKSITPQSGLDTGDGVGVTITLESLLGSSRQKSVLQKGNSIVDTAAAGLQFAAGKVNPF